MRRILCCIAVLGLAMTLSRAAAAEGKLPAPQKTGGLPVLEAIDQRGSYTHNGLPTGKLDAQDLSTILWAASGNNRDGRLWTVPMAMGRPPYCKVYVATDEGAFLYNWRKNELEEVSKDKVNPDIVMQDAFKAAPAVIYLVADGEEMRKMNNPMSDEFVLVLAGAMSQNIYLACGGVDVGARVVYSIKRDEAKKLLKLGENDKALFAIPVGKK